MQVPRRGGDVGMAGQVLDDVDVHLLFKLELGE